MAEDPTRPVLIALAFDAADKLLVIQQAVIGDGSQLRNGQRGKEWIGVNLLERIHIYARRYLYIGIIPSEFPNVILKYNLFAHGLPPEKLQKERRGARLLESTRLCGAVVNLRPKAADLVVRPDGSPSDGQDRRHHCRCYLLYTLFPARSIASICATSTRILSPLCSTSMMDVPRSTRTLVALPCRLRT